MEKQKQIHLHSNRRIRGWTDVSVGIGRGIILFRAANIRENHCYGNRGRNSENVDQTDSATNEYLDFARIMFLPGEKRAEVRKVESTESIRSHYHREDKNS